MGYNMCFAAGADKGIAYELYNKYFGAPGGGGRYGCMAPSMVFQWALSRDALVDCVQVWTRRGPILTQSCCC